MEENISYCLTKDKKNNFQIVGIEEEEKVGFPFYLCGHLQTKCFVWPYPVKEI